MVKPIEIKDTRTNDVYILEFSRESVMFAESKGFKVQDFAEGNGILSGLSDLFFYAFRMHHPKVSKAVTDRFLFEDMKGMPNGMVERLVELYTEPFSSLLTEDDEERKNSVLTVNF